MFPETPDTEITPPADAPQPGDSPSPEPSGTPDGPQIDQAGVTAVKQVAAPISTERETPPWEADDAPPGSTQASLMVHNNQGKPVRVLGPTHYQHLADGRIIPGYGGATHYSEPDGNGGERVTRVVASHAAL